jgi:hypothetical protein
MSSPLATTRRTGGEKKGKEGREKERERKKREGRKWDIQAQLNI